MTTPFRLACVQTNATNDMAVNLDAAEDLIRAAAADGADLISVPECVSMMEPDRDLAMRKAQKWENHPALDRFQNLARDLHKWLLVGSIAVDLGDGRIANRSAMIDDNGAVQADYDKIHMFDVDLPGGESYRESDTYRPGDAAAGVSTPWGMVGMTICYDLRFPGLYRSLARAGALYLAVPSAFTRQTGRAHWHVLLRARAIETGCFVFAAAQCGDHAGGRQTYGHSLIVDPWGKVLADGGEEVGHVIAEIDPAKVDAARRAMPSLDHEREFSPLRMAGDRPKAADG